MLHSILPRTPHEPPSTNFNNIDPNPNSQDPFKYAHGLTGVDQVGNWYFFYILVSILCGLVLLTLLYRILHSLYALFRYVTTVGNPDRQVIWSMNHSKWWAYLKQHLLYAPLWKKRLNRELQLTQSVSMGTLPSRFYIILLVSYMLCNVAYCLMLPWSKQEGQSIIAALRGRSGSLATLNLIPTILFALRNNPLIPLLRVSYDSFNLMHRWMARVVIVESTVHVACWLYNLHMADPLDGLRDALAAAISYRAGLISITTFLFLGIQAWSPIRRSFYETFLNIHRLGVLSAIIGLYFHLLRHGLPQFPWAIVIIGLWTAEWAIRIGRILYFNVRPRKITEVTVEALPGEACRVTFNLTHYCKPLPGSHLHVYLPSIALWSSHPFSVAWSETTSPPSLDEKLPVTENGSIFSTRKDSLATMCSSVSLVIRARGGMTRKLYEKASRQPGSVLRTWGAVEGPYGGHHQLHSYGTVMLFAGGVGITHQLTYVRELVARYAAGVVSTRKVILVWSIPNPDFLEWIQPWLKEILDMPKREQVLRVVVYASRSSQLTEGSSVTPEGVNLLRGRCSFPSIIDEEIKERIGAMVVTVCGPGAFSDSVRAAVRRRVKDCALDFIQEAFTY